MHFLKGKHISLLTQLYEESSSHNYFNIKHWLFGCVYTSDSAHRGLAPCPAVTAVMKNPVYMVRSHRVQTNNCPSVTSQINQQHTHPRYHSSHWDNQHTHTYTYILYFYWRLPPWNMITRSESQSELDFTKWKMLLDQHPCWSWNNIPVQPIRFEGLVYS